MHWVVAAIWTTLDLQHERLELDRSDRKGCRAQPYNMLIRNIARCSIFSVGEHRTGGEPRKHGRTSESVTVWTVCSRGDLRDAMQLKVAAQIWTGNIMLGGWHIMLVWSIDREFVKYSI
jgi:hypothetical protein